MVYGGYSSSHAITRALCRNSLSSLPIANPNQKNDGGDGNRRAGSGKLYGWGDTAGVPDKSDLTPDITAPTIARIGAAGRRVVSVCAGAGVAFALVK